MKDKEVTRKEILRIGRDEILLKGFQGAYLRDIAKKANVTTGAIYGHYSNKEGLFCALVQPVADEFLSLREKGHLARLSTAESDLKNSKWDSFEPIEQMIDYIYEHFDIFKLLICHAAETQYQDYITTVIEKETVAAKSMLEKMEATGIILNGIDDEFIDIITYAYYSNVFEIVRRDMTIKRAKEYVKSLSEFYARGWGTWTNDGSDK